jgi:DNA-binding response OmpR family regulator
MAHILVVDDEQAVADMVGRALRQDGHTARVATSPLDALEMAQRDRPDLIILDVIMPGMNGLEVCRRLRNNKDLADVPVVFLTARDQVEHLVQGFEAGADDYISKPFDLRELLMRVRAVLRRSMPPEPIELEVGPIRLNTTTFEVIVDGKPHLLTPMEFALLRHLMRHPGEVFSTERLLREVWGYPQGLGSPDLVRVHVRNLRLKIEPSPRNPIYICTVGRHGYTIRPKL